MLVFIAACSGPLCTPDTAQDCSANTASIWFTDEVEWVAGDYAFILSYDDKTVTCGRTIPLVGEAQGCNDAEVTMVSFTTSDGTEGLEYLQIDHQPEELGVVVERDGKQLFSDTWGLDVGWVDADADGCADPCAAWKREIAW